MTKPHIVIVGLGALGSHFVLAVRNWPVVLNLVDFDRVEAKNILSQNHVKLSRGKNKGIAMQQMMRNMFDTHVAPFPTELTSDNVTQLLNDKALIVDCTDNIKAREVMQKYCTKTGTPLLHGALAPGGTFGRVVWTEHFVADAETGDGATCEDGENLAFHIQVGSMMAQVAKQFLDSGKQASYQLTPFSVIRLA